MPSSSNDPMIEPSSIDDRRDEGTYPNKRRKKAQGVEGFFSRPEVGLMRDGANAPSFVGSASGIHFIRSVYGAIGSPEAEKTSPEANLVPGEDDQLRAGAQATWRASEVTDQTQQPTFDQLVSWSSNYFDVWHPAFPFLHAPTVLETFEAISQGNTTKVSYWDVNIVKAILSISLADRRQSVQDIEPVPRSLVFNTFDAAVESIQPALFLPTTISGIQAVICIQLYLISMLRLNAASRIGGLIVQMSYQLGLHRCPMRFTAFSADDRQLRKRIFWSLYCLERYSCQALGLPLMIHDEDVDVCQLNSELHKVENKQTIADETDKRLQLLVFLADHARLRGSIMELRNKRVEQRDKDPDTAIYITARLTEWWNDVEDHLDSENNSIGALHRTILETLRQESIIMLNRPLLASPKHTANHASAIHACIAAAKSLLSTLFDLCTQTAESGHKLPMVWPSFTWAAWMSSFIILFAKAEGKVNIQVADRNVDKGLRVLQQLAARESVWPQACAVAIEDLRSALTRRRPGEVSARNDPSSKSNAHLAGNNGGQQKMSPNVTRYSQLNNHENNLTHMQDPMQPPVRVPPTPSGQSQNSSSKQQNGSTDGFAIMYDQSQSAFQFPGENTWLDTNIFFNDLQPENSGSTDPLQGYDIPFWVGSDNTLAWMNNNM